MTFADTFLICCIVVLLVVNIYEEVTWDKDFK